MYIANPLRGFYVYGMKKKRPLHARVLEMGAPNGASEKNRGGHVAGKMVKELPVSIYHPF